MINTNVAVGMVNGPVRMIKKSLDRRFFVHLACIDDSGTNDKKRPYQVVNSRDYTEQCVFFCRSECGYFIRGAA